MTTTPAPTAALRACPCCGLVQRMPPVAPRRRACCARCRATLHRPSHAARAGSRTAAIAVAGLVIYPAAMTLPMLEVERLGHARAASILEGTAALLADGEWIVGGIVGLCSIVLPFGKLASLLVLTAGRRRLHRRHRALTYRVVELTGRWGMLDVLLVAVLVAALKLGDLVEVSAGPGALAFAALVVLSLAASASFDPHGIWEEDAA